MYTGGLLNGGYPLGFFVAPGGRTLLNVAIPGVYGNCVGTGGFRDHPGLAKAPIKPGGAFNATFSQMGVFGGYAAKFTFNFAGHFQAASGNTPARVTGSLRENIAYTAKGLKVTCTTNNQSWNATRSGPVPTHSIVAASGNYTGGNLNGGYPLSFSVAPGGHDLLNVAIPTVYGGCVGGGAFTHQVAIARVGVEPGGLFNSTTTETGVFNGANATFTYHFLGAFEGPNAQGKQTVAGMFREDIVYSSAGKTHTCTSGMDLWAAAKP